MTENTVATRSMPVEGRRAAALRSSRIIAIVIFVAAIAASSGGLALRAPGGSRFPTPFPSVVSALGETTRLDGQGLYSRDSASGAAQERAQDAVTLGFGLPLLALGWFLSGKGSLGGRLVHSGALGYFLYCYGMMAVGTAYNEFFLLYVGLFAASLWAFALSLSSFDVDKLASACASRYPRKSAVALCLAVGLFLGLNWLGGIILPSLASGRAPKGLESYSTLFVQALDLGVIVPAALVAAFWLLRRDARGYLLGTVLAVKGAAEGLAVSAMGLEMIRQGFADSLALVLGFLALALAALGVGIKAVLAAGFARTAAVRGGEA